jgi:AraC family transcriptional regulator
MANSPRSDYLARIHRAQDYIERHLSEELVLELVARAAHFSPFHFHRVFSAVVGETLYQFILRLRLERAASTLLQNRDRSVTEVALDCGFSSSATFARAFKAEYGMSASEWRECGGSMTGDSSLTDSKNRKAQSNLSKARAEWMDKTARVGAMPAKRVLMSIPAISVSVEELSLMTVAYVRHVGPYQGDAKLFERLFGQLMTWAGPRGLVKPATKTLVIYHDDPNITEAAKLRISCCISVPPDIKPEGEIGVMQVDGGKYACAKFELTSEDYAPAWQWFMGEWMPSSGYEPRDGHCYELYTGQIGTDCAGLQSVQFTMPVRPV